jgi:nucleoside-diphosphate-sugar epimerase
MERLTMHTKPEHMQNVRATRVNFFTQHDKETWIDQLGALGTTGKDSVFVNLAAVAGPIPDKPDAMMDVNYHALISAASACEELKFGHFIQSSTQATKAERSGQVPYAKHKAMGDYALARRFDMPVTIASLSLLYCREDVSVGQDKDKLRLSSPVKLNMIDLSLLPLTPIMGTGDAPLQPQEVSDAARRIAFLALSDPASRPVQPCTGPPGSVSDMQSAKSDLRFYDAVGPENVSVLELLSRFARYQGKTNFHPVFVDYRNFEKILNVRSLGNLNRQFVSLLRSEQDSVSPPLLGAPETWCSLLKPGDGGEYKRSELEQDAVLVTLAEAFGGGSDGGSGDIAAGDGGNDAVSTTARHSRRYYPWAKNALFIWQNPRVILPGLSLALEILASWLFRKGPIKYIHGRPSR